MGNAQHRTQYNLTIPSKNETKIQAVSYTYNTPQSITQCNISNMEGIHLGFTPLLVSSVPVNH